MGIQLNSAQKTAVESTSQNLLIIAGPGTGKTRVLVSKIQYATESLKIPAERILAITFSRKATEEMMERLGNLAETARVETLHSFSFSIVERHGFRLGIGRKPKLMSQADSMVRLKRLAKNTPVTPIMKGAQLDPVIEDLHRFMSDAKESGAWPEDLIKIIETWPTDTPEQEEKKREWLALSDLYNVFQSRSFQDGQIDFSDCILLATRLIEEFSIVRDEVQSQFDLILVDEFQDTNWSQIKFIRLISEKSKVVVVGDDDQSIYKFRGASYSAFRFFQESFPNSEIVELNETYRLPQSVAKASTELIQANGTRRFRPDKSIVSASQTSGKVAWWVSASQKQEAEMIARRIKDLISNGSTPESVAVLVRASSHADLIKKTLRQLDIPFVERNRASLMESDTFKDGIALLRLLANPNDSLSMTRLLDSPYLRLSGDDIILLLRDDLWNGNPSGLSSEGQKLLEIFRGLLPELVSQGTRSKASDLLLIALEKTEALKWRYLQMPDEARQLGIFFNLLKNIESLNTENDLRQTLPVLEEILISNTLISDEETSDDSTGVQILTVHGSKGLEFDYVFIPSLVSRRFPSNFRTPLWSMPEQLTKESYHSREDHIDEERRLLYVGMTRAKKELVLSSFEKKGTKSSLFLTEDLKNLWTDGSAEKRDLRDDISKDDEKFVLAPFSRVQIPREMKRAPKASLNLSYTQLEKYDTCPLSYQFKYDFKIPVRTPVQMSLGSAIHKALEDFYNQRKEGKNPSKEDLLSYFASAFEEEKKRSPDFSENQRVLGQEKLSHYFDRYASEMIRPFGIEVDFAFRVGPHLVRGKIDRVDKTDRGYRIVDYKTGKARSNGNTEDEKFATDSLQFSIYALAARDVFHWEIESLVFDYIYDLSTLSTSRSDAELVQVKEQIASIAERISKLEFPAKPGFHCQWCEYRSICPSAV